MSSRSLHEVSSNSSLNTENNNSRNTTHSADRALTVIVLGWAAAAVPGLLSSLQETAPVGSCVTVLHHKGQVHPDAEQAAVAAAAVAAATAAAVATAASQTSTDSSGTKVAEANSNYQHIDQQAEACPTCPERASISAQQEQQEEQKQHFSCRHMYVSEPCSVKALLSAGIAEADAIIIGGQLAPQASGEADAMVVAALLAVQQALQPISTVSAAAAWPSISQQLKPAADGRLDSTSRQLASGVSTSRVVRRSGTGTVSQLHVVAVLSSYSVRRAVQVFLGSMLVRSFSYEIMVLDEYAAAMLVQVSLCCCCCS